MNLALAAAALTGVQVGAAIVTSRFVVAEVPPLTLALLRARVRPAIRAMAPDLLPMALLGHDRITPALLGGVLLSIAGVALALAPKVGAGHTGHWWGELSVLGAVVLIACGLAFALLAAKPIDSPLKA